MRFLPVSLALLAFSSLAAHAAIIESEICVFGGNAGGVAAACTSARMGRKVVLAEPSRHVGGLTSGGLGWTDIGNKGAIGGFSRDFYKRLGKHYGKAEAWTFEPSVAERELNTLLKESGVPVYLEQKLATVTKDGTRITEITMENGDVYRAKMFIDCTYEGDLMAKAGVKYMVGRESNSRFGETLNGVRARTPSHQFTVPVDPYLVPGDPSSGLLPFIQTGDGGTPGEGDRAVQAYNFRLCLTKNPANKMPIQPPAGYDASRYELLGRYLQALVAAEKQPALRQFLKIDMVTREKTDINNNGGFSTDFIGANYEYPEADYATREKIWKEHEEYIRGLLTFLATDARVPEKMRAEMQEWGLCKDEFQDTGGWPHALYVREARRMLSDYVMTEADCRWDRKAEDPVGLGAYNMDSHNCQRLVRDGRVVNEGDVQVGVRGPYPVSYRSIVPKAAECENLLVPVCLSATHIAYGSIRMEPVFMILSQSAATAATMALEAGSSVQKVEYAALREKLLADGQILEWTAPPSELHTEVPPAPKLEGIVLDDASAQSTGEWRQGSLVHTRRVGEGYIHDGDEAKGEMSLAWHPEIPEPGQYEVIFHFPTNPNRATNVPVTVVAQGETRTVKVNQRDAKSGGAVALGRFHFPKGKGATISISNQGTDGFVVADGLQLVPVR